MFSPLLLYFLLIWTLDKLKHTKEGEREKKTFTSNCLPDLKLESRTNKKKRKREKLFLHEKCLQHINYSLIWQIVLCIHFNVRLMMMKGFICPYQASPEITQYNPHFLYPCSTLLYADCAISHLHTTTPPSLLLRTHTLYGSITTHPFLLLLLPFCGNFRS